MGEYGLLCMMLFAEDSPIWKLSRHCRDIRYDKQPGEQQLIRLFLSAKPSKEQVELLEIYKDGILVAEYWTELPPKALLEEKIHTALAEARERLSREKLNE